MLNDINLTKFVPLNQIAEQFLSEVAKSAKFHSAQKGNIIFKRGKILSEYYFLLEGEVDLIDNDFSIEKVKANSDRAFQRLNINSPTVVSSIAKSSVKYFSVPSSLIERLIADTLRPPQVAQDVLEDGAAEKGMQVGELHESSDWMSCILKSPLFARIPMTLLQELFGKFEKVYVKKGERVVREGAAGDYFYVMASGTALVSNRSGSVDLELKEGDYFGEEALLSNAPRNASITMTSDGVLNRLNAEAFAALVKNPVLRYVSLADLGANKKAFKILDVRLPIEYRACHMPGSLNIPLSRLRESINELSGGNVYAVSSEAGARADIAAYILCQAGFDAVIVKTEMDQVPEQFSEVS